MAPHNPDDNRDPQRDRPSHEDNPFIAFRRFADSQVSTLLNGLATLPEWIADYNSIKLAREQCLFGKASPEECKKLEEVETKIEKMYNNEFNLSSGNFTQAALRDNIDKYMKLESSAREIRTRIVEAGRGVEARIGGSSSQVDLIERVGNQKGQQWGWSWDWGFPKPFDSESGQQQDQQGRDSHCRRWHDRRSRNPRAEPETTDDHQLLDEATDALRRMAYQDNQCMIVRGPRSVKQEEEFSASFSPSYLSQRGQFRRSMPSHFDILFQERCSPRALENNDDLKDGLWRDALEDLLRLERGLNMIPYHQLGKSRTLSYDHWALPLAFPRPSAHAGDMCPVPRETFRGRHDEEPSYEYGHDHEDQHDDPPTSRPDQGQWTQGTPETELEAYERILGSNTTQQSEDTKPSRPSVLSTLTTTERTVGLDGTITTKVVLKRRFSDGKEESTETTHTHRGDGQSQDPWKAFQESEVPPPKPKPENSEKKKGWFWSN